MKLGMYSHTNAMTTIARLHLSQFLWRRIRSSIVIGKTLSAEGGEPRAMPGNPHYAMPCSQPSLKLRRPDGPSQYRPSGADKGARRGICPLTSTYGCGNIYVE